MELLRSELIETYTQRLIKPTLPVVVPELQYRDFAHWQRRLRDLGTFDQLLAWWKSQLQDLPTRIDLPIEKPRPAYQTFHGDRVDLVFSDHLTAQLKRFNATHRVTHFMTFHAAVALLLARLSGQSVICTGSPTAGRHHKALESMLGMFVNTLAIPTRIHPTDTFTSLIERVRRQILACFAHQDVSLDRVVEVVQPQRDLSHPPLFQVMLSVTQENPPQQPAPGISWELFKFNLPTIKVELEWSIVSTENQITGSLGYNTDLFLPQTARRFSRQLTLLLEQFIAQPHMPWHAAHLLTPEERKAVIHDFNANPQHPLPAPTVLPLIQHWVHTKSEATALMFDPLDGGPLETCSYATMVRESNALSQPSSAAGCGP